MKIVFNLPDEGLTSEVFSTIVTALPKSGVNEWKILGQKVLVYRRPDLKVETYEVIVKEERNGKV